MSLLHKLYDNFFKLFYSIRAAILVNNRFAYISTKAKLVGRRNIKVGNGTSIFSHVELNTSPNPYGIPYRRKVSIGKIEIGRNCRIKDYSKIITYSGFVRIGNNCSINPFSVIYGHMGVKIGDNVMIANKVTIVAANHGFTDLTIEMKKQSIVGKGIIIEDDVWIGANVTILDGVKLKKGCIVAAGSVVNKDVEAYAIVGGVPARHIKNRMNLKVD